MGAVKSTRGKDDPSFVNAAIYTSLSFRDSSSTTKSPLHSRSSRTACEIVLYVNIFRVLFTPRLSGPQPMILRGPS